MTWLPDGVSYLALRASGFNKDAAEALVNSKVPVGFARDVGPERLSNLEAIALLHGAIKRIAAKGFCSTGQIARHRKDFSVEELLSLSAAEKSGQGIGLKDVIGYEAAGLRTAGDMLTAFNTGLVYGSHVPGYQKLGVTKVEDMADLTRACAYPFVVAGYQKLGIGSFTAMAALSSSGVGYVKVIAYQENGAEDADLMLSLHRDGIDGENFGAYQKAGITEPKVMKALRLGGVDGFSAINYKAAGFQKPEEMILLMAHKIRAGGAWELARTAGFEGDLAGMVKLVDAGLVQDSEDSRYTSGQSCNLVSPQVVAYARAGFAGHAEEMVTLSHAGVPGPFAMAQLELLNGHMQTKKPHELARILIETYSRQKTAVES